MFVPLQPKRKNTLMMKKTFIAVMFLALAVFVKAQTMEYSKYEVPEYSISDAQSCKQYNHNILECVHWLENVSPNIFKDEQVKAKKFLIEWATLSSDVSVVMDEKIVTFIKSSPDMLVYYVGGWVKKSLTTKNKLFKSDYAYAGLQSVMNYYKRYNKLVNQDLNIEKLIQMDSNGALLIQLQKDMIKYDFN